MLFDDRQLADHIAKLQGKLPKKKTMIDRQERRRARARKTAQLEEPSRRHQAAQRSSGTVKHLNAFLDGDDGTEVFLHGAVAKRCGLPELKVGQRLRFVAKGERGLRAVDVALNRPGGVTWARKLPPRKAPTI